MTRLVNSNNIEAILQAGESDTVEFKGMVRPGMMILPKLISAFANTKGGIVIFGYLEMKQKVVGVSSEDLTIIKTELRKYDLENLCDIYTVSYNDQTLIIVQVKQSESVIVSGGAAYVRTGDSNVVLSSKEYSQKIKHSLEAKVSLDDRLKRLEKININTYKELNRQRKELEEVNKKLVEANNKLDEAKIEHENELREAEEKHKKELKSAKKSNWFFAFISALMGWILGQFFKS